MTKAKTTPKTAKQIAAPHRGGDQPKAAARETCSDRLVAMMQTRQGASAQELADAVGWQVHSVRSFISGNLKKRGHLEVTATKVDGLTRYRVRARKGAAA